MFDQDWGHTQHGKKTYKINLNSNVDLKNNKIYVVSTAEETKNPPPPFSCLLDIKPSKVNPGRGEINVYLDGPEYKDWNISVSIDGLGVEMLEPIKKKI